MWVRPAERTLVLAVAVSFCALAPAATAQRTARPRRILLLYQQQAETKPMLEFTQQLRLTIDRELGPSAELYQEALDLDRFADREHSAPLVGYFKDKYGGFSIDVIVPVGGRALSFAIDQLRGVLPNVPIVFALCAAPQTNPASLPAYVTGRLATASRFVPTLSMAQRLQPDAEHVVVVGGAGASDSTSVAAVLSAINASHDSIPLTVLQGLPLDILLARLRQLSRRSIVVFANYRQDGRGQVFEPFDIVGSLAHASSAPMYTQLLSYVGEGVVGGSVTRFDDEGSNTGRLIVRVLRRPRGERMPPVQFILNSYVADWRQLRRWGLSDERLPSGTEVLFRQPSPWERYRRAILVTLGVLSAQLLLIGLLLIERARRKQAQMVIEEQQRRVEEARRQIVHMGRVALVGELAATIGHEIRQPLAAIRANAEAGARFVSGKSKEFAADDRQISADIFADIVADTDRVSATITRVRALLRNEELPAAPVDLNDVCRTAARLLQHDALTRNAEIALLLDPDLPAIAADSVQFLQVVLNLVLNALDASSSSIHPEVLITTSARDEGVEVAVSDNGPGLAADVQQHLFESFFTTKTQGLGLGLVIVQSIVERHGGRVRPENRVQGGATFRITIPRARSGQFASSATSQNRLESEKAPVRA